MILGEGNQKMSKSLGNVINPDDIIREYGADSMRVYEMFMGPLEGVQALGDRGPRGREPIPREALGPVGERPWIAAEPSPTGLKSLHRDDQEGERRYRRPWISTPPSPR